MKVALHKMHGAGNAYLVVNAAVHPSLRAPSVALRACRRRVGLDADGLACVTHLGRRLFDIAVYNANGSESGFNGNALRCCARWIHDEYGYPSMVLRQGPIVSPAEVDDNSVRMRFSLSGAPRPAGTDASDLFPVMVEKSEVLVSWPGLDGGPARSRVGSGADERARTLASGRANVVSVDAVERDRLHVTTFEVGVGTETLSSATGAAAAVAIGKAAGRLRGERVRVHSAGGELLVYAEDHGSGYWVDGRVEYIFSGDYHSGPAGLVP